jgi:hypothetical protein
MRKLLATTGFLLLALPIAVSAQSLFDMFFADTGKTSEAAYPSDDAAGFTIQEMRRWNGQGVVLTPEDLRYAVDGDLGRLCNRKQDSNGGSVEFLQGADASVGGSCIGMQTAILSLLAAEREGEDLTSTLHSIAYGSELATADEINHSLNVGSTAELLRRLWSGTSAAIIPWDPAADGAVRSLAAALSREKDPGRAILRFRHGYFREQREGSSPYGDTGADVQASLKEIADILHIAGDPLSLGEYPSQNLPGFQNAVLWARKDDLGVTWIYPESYPYRLSTTENGSKIYERDGIYPSIAEGAETTAYPFWQPAPENPSLETPLCSRTTARHGYLCRPVQSDDAPCVDPDDPDAISLLVCSVDVKTHAHGPDECDQIRLLFQDDGRPLVDPADPGHVDPTLTPADIEKICTPETRVLYKDDLISHACYAALCLRQSEDTNALIPGRNPTLVGESLSPYLACIRDDPQLARSIEVSQKSPYSLPPYIGHFLVRDFEQEYCAIAGQSAHPVLGFCTEREDERTQSPTRDTLSTESTLLEEAANRAETREEFLGLAAAIGQRAAVDQSLDVHRKIFASLASFIKQVANLFLELKKAPLTDNACPWTGPPQQVPSQNP